MSTTSEPVRIAFCITDLDPGGAERALVQIVTRLDRAEWSPRVFCLAPRGALADTLESSGIPVVCLGARHWSNLTVVARLRRELKQFRPRLLQTFLFHANIAGRIAAWLAGVPIVVSGIRVAEKRSPVYRWIDRLTSGLVATNVCVSQAVADFSIRTGRLKADKIVVIPNGVDVSVFSQAAPADLTRFGIPPRSRVLIFVGRLDPQKGVRDFIETAAQVVPHHADVHFLLVGAGPQEGEVRNLVAQHKLSDRVHVAGWRSDVAHLLRAAYAFVLPSHWEGMPNAVLEAMAAGLPVVATRVEGVDEAVIDGESGLLVPAGETAELAGAMQKLLADSNLARQLGEAGQKRVSARFLWEITASEYERLYRNLLSRPR